MCDVACVFQAEEPGMHRYIGTTWVLADVSVVGIVLSEDAVVFTKANGRCSSAVFNPLSTIVPALWRHYSRNIPCITNIDPAIQL